MSARDRILGRVRQGLSGSGTVSLPDRGRPRGPHVTWPSQDRVQRFTACSLRMGTTLQRAGTLEEVPSLVARYLGSHGLPLCGVAWPSLRNMEWVGAGLALEYREAHAGDAVGITSAFCALEETGTLLLVSGPETPASVSLLPETHIALLDAGRLRPHMEDAFDQVMESFSTWPRALNFISGPSRTADIEQTIVIGAHGPARVHVVLYGQ